jgi:hypothetical protein
MTESFAGGAAAAPLSMRAAASLTAAAVRAARQLLTDLERGRRINTTVLRSAMEAAFGASDAVGAWHWKTACDVCQVATVLFLRKFSPAIRAKAGATAAMLPILARIAGCLPTHTWRSEDRQTFQQFSTPVPRGLAARSAVGITPADGVLQPSAGTGSLAIFAELAEPPAALLDHRLRAYGLFGAIIAWKLRMFVPIGASGVGLLARVLDRYPVDRIVEREAA